MSEFQQVVKDGAKKVGQTMKRALLVLLLLAVVGTGVYIWVCSWTYSEGTRAGYLIKISRKGVLWKTYEGQLNTGGFTLGDQMEAPSNVWEFSVPRREVYQQMEDYEGQRVKLRYRQVYKPMPWQGKTEYFVYDITPVK